MWSIKLDKDCVCSSRVFFSSWLLCIKNWICIGGQDKICYPAMLNKKKWNYFYTRMHFKFEFYVFFLLQTHKLGNIVLFKEWSLLSGKCQQTWLPQFIHVYLNSVQAAFWSQINFVYDHNINWNIEVAYSDSSFYISNYI